jgi:hypothetical protein
MKQLAPITFWLFVCAGACSEIFAQRKAVSGAEVTPDGVAAGDNPCKITLKFSKPGTLIVTTENGLECGFGLNVSADGRYKKTSGAKPKFSAN